MLLFVRAIWSDRAPIDGVMAANLAQMQIVVIPEQTPMRRTVIMDFAFPVRDGGVMGMEFGGRKRKDIHTKKTKE